MGLWTLKGFLYLYTLQVGVTIISTWGFGLMTIAVLVNVSGILTSLSYPDYGNELTLAETGVHYAVFFLFISLGYVAYVSGLTGVYQEKVFPLYVATGILCGQAVFWLLLTVLSFINVPQLMGFFCVDHIRCADRFFISNANWRFSPTEPDYFWNFYPSVDPSKIFRSNHGCWDYCRMTTSNIDSREAKESTTGGTVSDGNVTASIIVAATEDMGGNFSAAAERLESTEPSTNKKVTTTEESPDRKKRIEEENLECVCYKTRVPTLVGPVGSLAHLAFTVIFSVLILVFWYGYSICVILSYIHYLKTEHALDNESEIHARH